MLARPCLQNNDDEQLFVLLWGGIKQYTLDKFRLQRMDTLHIDLVNSGWVVVEVLVLPTSKSGGFRRN